MSLFQRNNTITIDKKLFEELCQYVYPKDIEKTIANLIQQYIDQKKANDSIIKANDSIIIDSSDKMTKTKAKKLFQKDGYPLYKNCTFASINKSSYCYWANPNPEFFKDNWSLLLHNQHKKRLYLLNIPQSSLSINDFYLKSGSIPNLLINPDNLTDSGIKQINFSRYVVAEINYK